MGGRLEQAGACPRALHELDVDPAGFEWVLAGDADISVLAYLRRSKAGEPVLVVCNFTPSRATTCSSGCPPTACGTNWSTATLPSTAAAARATWAASWPSPSLAREPPHVDGDRPAPRVRGLQPRGPAMNPHRWELGGVPALPRAAATRCGPARDQRCSFVVWAPSRARWRSSLKAARRSPCSRGPWLLRRRGGALPPRVSLSLLARRHRPRGPGVALAADGVAGPPRWSSPGRSSRYQRLRGGPLAESCSTSSTSARSPPGDLRLGHRRARLARRARGHRVEAMPIAQFSGTRNWGYDGVPLRRPALLRRPRGVFPLRRRLPPSRPRRRARCRLQPHRTRGSGAERLRPYFTDRYATPWGEAVNVDGRRRTLCGATSIENALSWFRDFGLDGLRLDAIHGDRRPDRHTLFASWPTPPPSWPRCSAARCG